jgi:translocation and assembly module TamB
LIVTQRPNFIHLNIVNQRITQILLITLLIPLLLIGVLMFLLTTPVGQQFVTNQVNSYLVAHIKSPFRVGTITYHVPDWIELGDVYVETPDGDTLLTGQKLRLDLDMLALVQQKVALNQIDLDHFSLHLTRLADARSNRNPQKILAFNFQYLLDAFAAPDSAKPDTDTVKAKPLAINLSQIFLHDVRIRYADDVAGVSADVVLDSLRTRFNETDVAKSRYRIRDLTANGLTLKTRLYAGIPTPPEAPKNLGDTLDLGLGSWKINRARWDIRAETADLQTTGRIGKFQMEADYLHLSGQRVGIKSLTLTDSDLSATLLATLKKSVKPPKTGSSTAAQPNPTRPISATTNPAWQAAIGQLTLTNNTLRFDNQNTAPQRTGLDYNHLVLSRLSLNGQKISYCPTRSSGQFRGGTFRDKSGFVLQKLDADVVFGNTELALTNLLVQTPGTLLRDRLTVRYDSLGQLGRPEQASRVRVALRLKNSVLAGNDVLYLAPFLATMPPFVGNQNLIFRADALATGTAAVLTIPTMTVSTLTGTRFNAKGRLTNLLDPNRLGLDLTILEAATNRADIARLAPKNSIPKSVALPNNLRLAGTLKGLLNALTINAKLNSDWGTAAINALLSGFVPPGSSGKKRPDPTYTGTADLTNFDAGKWLKQPDNLGIITGHAEFNGRGIDPKTMTTRFRLLVAEAVLRKYPYHRFNAQGELQRGTLTINGSIDDPNAVLTFANTVGLQSDFPTINGVVDITQLDLAKLGLYADPLAIRGKIALNLTNTNPDNLQGTIVAKRATVQYKGKNYPVDSVYLLAKNEGANRLITARLPFAVVNVRGNVAYTRLYDLLVGAVSPYFQIPQLTYKPLPAPYFTTINGTVWNNPLLTAFAPKLTRLDSVRVAVQVDSQADTVFSGRLNTGLIQYDTSAVKNVNLTFTGRSNQLAINGNVADVQTSGIATGPVQLTGVAEANQLRFSVINPDSVGKPRNALNGQLALVGTAYQLRLNRAGLLTNYLPWVADSTGFLQYGQDVAGQPLILAQQFKIQSAKQTILVNSVDNQVNGPLAVRAENVNLGTVANLTGQDSTLVGGVLNGNVILKNYLTKPTFTGDVRIDSLRMMKNLVGTLTGQFSDAPDGRIAVAGDLTGNGNQVAVTGFYNPSSTNDALDFRVNLNRLTAKTIESFSFGELKKTTGALTGQFTVTGAATKPRLNGGIDFDSVSLNISRLNTAYLIDKQRIKFNNEVIQFDDFVVADTLNQKLTTNGIVSLSDLPNIGYALRLNADDVLVLNAARKDNDYAYGQAAVTARLQIRGTNGNASVTGLLKLADKSRVTLVLPDQNTATNEARQVVTFIDHRDSLALQKYLVQRPRLDTLARRTHFNKLADADVSVNLETTDKAEINVIVDELNGDNLRIRGNAQLTAGINAANEISLSGRYTIAEGEYNLSYQVIKKQFKIQKGGTLTWTGDPYKADIDLTAVYQTKAQPYDLLANEIKAKDVDNYKQPIPFNVALRMRGNLAAPQLSFDITVPEAGFASSSDVVSAVNNKLLTMRDDPSELNKQVFALLVLGNFLSESSAGSFSGLNFDAGQLAFNSVSKLLTQQLNQFASNVIKGVAVDVNLANTNLSSAQSQTDLNVGLSKSFLSGRLSVAVGRNFVLQNSSSAQRNPSEVFDNISLNYALSRDGRYMARAYRKNEFQAVLDGYVVETGLGFVITVDMDTLRELIKK